MHSTLRAIAQETGTIEPGSHFAVVVTDDDRASVCGIYTTRASAQRVATLRSGEKPNGWLRGYVASAKSGGGIVVMSGPVVIGTANHE